MNAKYEKLANLIKDSIPSLVRQGELKLPTEADFCNRYNISRETVRRAIDTLVEEGIVYRIQGSGTFIRPYTVNSYRRDIAIILPTSTEYIYPALIKDLSLNLTRQNYNPSIYISDNSINTERQILASFDTDTLAGIIAEPVKSFLPTPNIDLYEKFDSLNIPVLFIKSSYSNLSNFLYIRGDDNYGGYLAGKHLIEKGHTKISFLLNRDSAEGLDRLSGALAALTDSSFPIDDDIVYWFNDENITRLRFNEDISFINDFIDKKTADTTACICQNDEIAYFLIRELSRRKIQIPSEFAVVSFDNSYLSDFGQIPITSLACEDGALHSTICETMLHLINGESTTSSTLSWHIIQRKST